LSYLNASQIAEVIAYCLAVYGILVMIILADLALNHYLTLSDPLISSTALNWDSWGIGNLIAQSVSDTNVLGQMVSIWNTFIRSGQIWAFLIGFVLGYLLRGITA
jgi:hypothetical protein